MQFFFYKGSIYPSLHDVLFPCYFVSLVAEDKLVPGRHVYMRQMKGSKYETGLILQIMDSIMVVKLDSFFMPFPLDCNDLAAVVLDKIPKTSELKIGTKVIAKEPEETLFAEGTVAQMEEKNGQLSYLVRYADRKEGWNALEDIRVMTTTKPGSTCGNREIKNVSLNDRVQRFLN